MFGLLEEESGVLAAASTDATRVDERISLTPNSSKPAATLATPIAISPRRPSVIRRADRELCAPSGQAREEHAPAECGERRREQQERGQRNYPITNGAAQLRRHAHVDQLEFLPKPQNQAGDDPAIGQQSRAIRPGGREQAGHQRRRQNHACQRLPPPVKSETAPLDYEAVDRHRQCERQRAREFENAQGVSFFVDTVAQQVSQRTAREGNAAARAAA